MGVGGVGVGVEIIRIKAVLSSAGLAYLTGAELGNMKEDCFDSSSLWGPCDQTSVSVSAVSAVYTQPVHTDLEINRLID